MVRVNLPRTRSGTVPTEITVKLRAPCAPYFSVSSEISDLAGSQDGLDQVFGNVPRQLVAHLAAGDFAGLDRHFVLYEIFVAVAALGEMKLEVGAALGGKVAADVLEQEFRELAALHFAGLPKWGASMVRRA